MPPAKRFDSKNSGYGCGDGEPVIEYLAYQELSKIDEGLTVWHCFVHKLGHVVCVVTNCDDYASPDGDGFRGVNSYAERHHRRL